jgi:hypothetical protein
MTDHELPVAGTVLTGGSMRLSIRGYFSTHLLAAAAQMSRAAAEVEKQHDTAGRARFDLDHRGHVLGAILCGVGFFEAMVNELFQDAMDGYAPEGGSIASLQPDTRLMMAEYWRATDQGERGRTLDKYQTLLQFAKEPVLDKGAQAYQDAGLAIQLRNAIAHYRPEDLSVDEPARMERRLRGRFVDNRLFAGDGGPWWPNHCLGAGCARWVIESVVTVTDRVTAAVGVKANYTVHRATGWFSAEG